MFDPSWRSMSCDDCRKRADFESQARGAYSSVPRVNCMDGQDGLCSEHRAQRRRTQTTWRHPVPEGQE